MLSLLLILQPLFLSSVVMLSCSHGPVQVTTVVLFLARATQHDLSLGDP